MHEMGLALEIYRICRETADANGGGRLDRVLLAVGELAAVEPDLIRFAWQAVTAETSDAEALLDIDWRPARQHCPWCQEAKSRIEGGWLRLCPDCERPLDVSGGDELDIVELSFTRDDDEIDRDQDEGCADQGSVSPSEQDPLDRKAHDRGGLE